MTMNPSSSVRCARKRGGRLQKWHPVDLLGETLRQLVERSGINPPIWTM